MPTLKGVYSSRKTGLPSIGGPRRSSPQKRFFIAWEHDVEYMIVQPLNQNLIQVGHKRLVPRADFDTEYAFEPEYRVDPESTLVRPIWRAQEGAGESAPEGSLETPAAAPPEISPEARPGTDDAAPRAAPAEQKKMEEPVEEEFDDFTTILPDEGVAFRPPGQASPGKAEPEPRADITARKVALDEEPYGQPGIEGIRPTRERTELERVEREAQTAFALGVTHLKRGNTERARAIFAEIAETKADFLPEHKHMFNEFGIGLRKSAVHDLALRHYRRALELSRDDENLHHNMARVYWEMGDLDNCARYLEKSLELNPKLHESQLFLRFLQRQKQKKKKSAIRELFQLGGKDT